MTDPVRAIADAVLYEGYVLWPYRASALKNQRRWTFGGVYPEAHSREHPDDRCLMRTQCLMAHPPGRIATAEVSVRFLHVVRREVEEGADLAAWDEAAERELGPGPIDIPFGVERHGAVVRSWERLCGSISVAYEPVGEGLQRVTVDIANSTPWDGDDRQEVLRRTFCSTHAVLRAHGGEWVSLTDPPDGLRDAAAACSNEGTWPVLVGEEGSRDTVLSSPIILEDHPRIAPESPGDLFDGGEIDQMLVLNILTLTDEEKAEMRAADPRTREILERTEALTPDELMRLHGRLSDLREVRAR